MAFFSELLKNQDPQTYKQIRPINSDPQILTDSNKATNFFSYKQKYYYRNPREWNQESKKEKHTVTQIVSRNSKNKKST